MADIWQSGDKSFIRFPLAAVAYPAKPGEVMESILDWCLLRVGSDIAHKPEVCLTDRAELLAEIQKKLPDLWKTYQPKTLTEGWLLLGSKALKVNFKGNALKHSAQRAEQLTKWLIDTGAMRQADNWKGVNTITMTMTGMGQSNAWWDAIEGVRAQTRGGINRAVGHLTWDEFRVYAAILSVTGSKQWARCTREDIAARAAGWVGVKARDKADPKEIERRRAAGLMLTDKAVRTCIDYLEKAGRMAKVRWGYRTVYFGIGLDRDELRQKIAAKMQERALAQDRVKTNRQTDLAWTAQVRASIAAAKRQAL